MLRLTLSGRHMQTLSGRILSVEWKHYPAAVIIQPVGKQGTMSVLVSQIDSWRPSR